MKIFDNHVHLRPDTVQFFLKAYKKAGGTSLNLVNLTESCFTIEEFISKYEETISISNSLRENGLEVVVTIGPYPVNYITLWEKLGSVRGKEVFQKAIDKAITMIEEGKANAVGEVGRPHFQVDPDILQESNEIMEYIFQATSDKAIPVILHTESLDVTGMCKIMEMARKKGKESLVVKHFSQPIFDENCGIVPSVPANRKNGRNAPWGRTGFFLETDFAGDEKNPNFVLPPDSVPRRVTMLLQEGIEREKIESSMSFFEDFYKLQ